MLGNLQLVTLLQDNEGEPAETTEQGIVRAFPFVKHQTGSQEVPKQPETMQMAECEGLRSRLKVIMLSSDAPNSLLLCSSFLAIMPIIIIMLITQLYSKLCPGFPDRPIGSH